MRRSGAAAWCARGASPLRGPEAARRRRRLLRRPVLSGASPLVVPSDAAGCGAPFAAATSGTPDRPRRRRRRARLLRRLASPCTSTGDGAAPFAGSLSLPRADFSCAPPSGARSSRGTSAVASPGRPLRRLRRRDRLRRRASPSRPSSRPASPAPPAATASCRESCACGAPRGRPAPGAARSDADASSCDTQASFRARVAALPKTAGPKRGRPNSC